MSRAPRPRLRFLRALLKAGAAERDGDTFRLSTTSIDVCLPAHEVRELQAAGIVGGDRQRVTVTAQTAGWLRRQMIDADAFAAQHRELLHGTTGLLRNLKESPLARLASPTGDEPAFLERHHSEAGERVRRLVERAALRSRVTMNYSGIAVAKGSGTSQVAELSTLAVDARRALRRIYETLPRDCAAVVVDVCGYEKGLQQVETERGWPRRSAKLVLRIGLDRLAEVWGINAQAIGRGAGDRSWMEGERPPIFAQAGD
jgi:hypothetical protein